MDTEIADFHFLIAGSMAIVGKALLQPPRHTLGQLLEVAGVQVPDPHHLDGVIV